MVMRKEATFPLAARLREEGSAPLGELFAFMSGLYFRGKLAYASAFARPPEGVAGALVITCAEGLLPPETQVTRKDLQRWARIAIDLDEPRYLKPFLRDATALASSAAAGCEIVLLGSIATDKYVGPLSEALGDRLHFPDEFAGRGDMSRGGLMLRCAREGVELAYSPLATAKRHGKRPPKL
jgi:hypothetical protein